MLRLFSISIITSLLFNQNMPGEPHIAWMETNYTFINSPISTSITWDMWWGENGDHWKLKSNDVLVFETEIISNSPQIQSGSTNYIILNPGEYNLTVELCNGFENEEVCHSSSPKLITIISGNGGPVEINHGAGISNWGNQFYSPFVDATGWPPLSLHEFSSQTGVKYFNLGFIVDRTGSACEASWGGFYAIDGWTEAGDFIFPLIENNEIGYLRQIGGDVMVSIGGATNTPLASSCESVDALAEQYQLIIDEYDLTHLDFDIEGIWVLDNEATERRSNAIALVQSYMQSQNRPLKIWYTLPVLPNGLTVEGVNIVNSALENGVELSGVNIMAMDYGYQTAPNPENYMGEYAILSAESLHSQLTILYSDMENNLSSEDIWQKIGITPMIGMNDVTTEIFNLEDAEQLKNFGLEMNIKQLSIWSANRDKECEDGVIDHVDISCSSILQDNHEFSLILNEYSEIPGLFFEKNIIGYFTSWGVYARDYKVMDIPATKVNFINYAFANINPNSGTIVLGDSYADIDQFYPGDCWDAGCLRGSFHQLQLLKEMHPHIKTLISIGGWTWSTYFSDIAMTEESREIFAQSCIEFITQYGFDGIDLDWEYPVEGGLSGNHHNSDDGENLSLLVTRIRELLDELTNTTNQQYYLTIAASANPSMMDNLELDILSEKLDWINIMSYDFHGPWSGEGDPTTNFNSALYPSENDPSPEPYGVHFNLSMSVQNYIERGVPREKLHAGLAFYGRAFGGVENINNGLYQNYSGPSSEGTWEDGVFDFYDLQDNYIELNGYQKFWHNESKVPWLYNPNNQIMISYDDEESISLKAEYIIQENLGGAMFWEFSGDRYGNLLEVTYNTLINADINPIELIGDVNLDELINVLDIILIVSLILNNDFNISADMNFDGTLNVTDIIVLVNQILSS